MGDYSKIEWTDASWNPVRGCSRVSEGCRNCYAERDAVRIPSYRKLVRSTPSGPKWTGEVLLIDEALKLPLRWQRPRRIFVNSMSDLFHEKVPDEWVDLVFGVMIRSPRHTFQILTKRPERMRTYLSDPATPSRIESLVNRLQPASDDGLEEVRPIPGYPGYFASSLGAIYSEKRGRRRLMRPDAAEQGHMRVQLHREGGGKRGERLLVHRLVLETFVGPPPVGAEGRHLDGDPKHNAISNLRWGSQEDNRADSLRHGTARRYHKLGPGDVAEIRRRGAVGEATASIARNFSVSDTQIRNILHGRQWVEHRDSVWPLANVWAGVSVEDQATADERIPLLLRTPAAVRWVSYEPALGAVDVTKWLSASGSQSDDLPCHECGSLADCDCDVGPALLDWLVVGGESGPGARPFDLAWARSVITQCRAEGVRAFFKQAGTRPALDGQPLRLKDRKGGDLDELPVEFRVREFPDA